MSFNSLKKWSQLRLIFQYKGNDCFINLQIPQTNLSFADTKWIT